MIASALKNGLLFVLALALSVFVWVVAQVEQNPEQRDTVTGIPIEVRNVPVGVVVSRLDQAVVSIAASAPKDVWGRLDNRSFRAWIDLGGLDAGVHDVTVNVAGQERAMRVQRVTPLYVTAELERIKQKVVPVVVSILDSPASGYSMGAAVVTPTQVLISGRQSVVDQVTEALAQARVEGARGDVVRAARPVLQDGRGSEVRGTVSVSPESVSVSVPIFQLLSYKTVALRAIITGTVAAGYRLTSVVVEPQTVTLGGDPRALEAIGYVDTSVVDISGARADVTKPAPIILPAGVATERRSDVFVNVRVEPIPGQEIIRRPVTILNLDKNLRVVAPVTPTIEIELSGPLADLTRITSMDITVTVNLTGALPGVVERAPVITGVPKSLTIVRVNPEKLIILLDPSNTPTPTPTRSLGATPLPQPQGTPTPATPTPTATPQPTGYGGRWPRGGPPLAQA